MLMRSKVTYQGQGSSEVKLGGKCWFSLFGSPLKSWSSIGTKLGSWTLHGNLHMLMRSRSNTEVKGHLRSSWKKSWKLEMCYLGLLWKVEVRLEPNLVHGYNMATFICWWGQRSSEVKLEEQFKMCQLTDLFFELFLCELLWYCSSLQVTATLQGGSRKFTWCIF